MASARKKVRPRETVSRGPSGFTVFIFFLLLAAICIGAGYTLGHYILTTLSGNVADDGTPSAGETGGSGGDSGDTGGGSGEAGPGGIATPGGGPGTVDCEVNCFSLYTVQIGAFGSRVNADKAVSDLASKSYAGYVLAPGPGSTLYRVWSVTSVKREIAGTAAASLRSASYTDCFIVESKVNSRAITLKGSSTDYLNRLVAGVKALSTCLESEGQIWDKYHTGALNPTTSGATIDTLIAAVKSAKDGLDAFKAPSDLASLGEAVTANLASAQQNLASLKVFVSSSTGQAKVEAESSYIALVDSYLRLAAGLGSE